MTHVNKNIYKISFLTLFIILLTYSYILHMCSTVLCWYSSIVLPCLFLIFSVSFTQSPNSGNSLVILQKVKWSSKSWYCGVSFSNEKRKGLLIIYNNLDESPDSCLKHKKAAPKGYIPWFCLYNFICKAGWPLRSDPPTPASRVLGLQVHATILVFSISLKW